MSTQLKSSCLLFLALNLCRSVALCHEQVVHREITEHGIASAYDNSTAFFDFIGIISTDCDYQKAVDSMVDGSDYEDFFRKDDGGMRFLNHFYDPLTGLGLSNIPIDDRMSPFGESSFKWASTFECPGINVWVAGIGANVDTYNKWSWQNARDYEWHGLTEADPADRQEALLDMFRALGQVIHLLEDASQPQHTRNEQHGLPRSKIEPYGGHNVGSLNYQHALLPWRANGFTKLEDFWDRGKYDGQNSSVLVADANAIGESAARLGLAEFSNGNLLGEHHLFPEYYKPGWVQYYPFPSRNSSTTYKQVIANPSSGIDFYTLENGQQRKGIYLQKNADGASVPHLARVNYLGAKITGQKGVPYCTVNDPNVLKDYHDIMIPKAVEYSAGILDYFFCGKLDVTAWYDDIDLAYYISIANKSGTHLSGGSFALFQESANGTRTPVAWQNLNYAGELADGECIEGTIPGLVSTATKFIVVYKGTIGSAGGQPLDPVERDTSGNGIAIAAKTFSLYPVGSYPTQGPRVRIKDFARVAQALGGCSDCNTGSQPAWDGTFDEVEFWWDPYFLEYWYNCYPSSGLNSRSLNGKVLFDPYVWWNYDLETYELRISCKNQQNQTLYIWKGVKAYGSDATGVYVRDTFDACNIGFCAEGLEQIVLESY